jgi:hypothetical protein
MPARHHSRATRLAATFLARLASPEVAASTFRVDVRTVRNWQAGSVELPADQWEAIEAVLLARGGEQAAKGETRGLVQTLTGAGIAARNRRYAQLIAQREARRQGEAEMEQPPREPWRDALHALSDSRQLLMRDSLHLEIAIRDLPENRGKPLPESQRSEEEGDAVLLEWVQHMAAMSDEDVAAESQQVRAKLKEVRAAIEADYERQPQAPVSPSPPVPATPVAAPEAPKPALRAVDDHDHPSWQPFRRYDL